MIIFSKPPDKNIDWEIWNPIVPRNLKKYLSFAILGVSVVFSMLLVFVLLQNPYRAAIYDILYNAIIFNILLEPTAIAAQIVAIIIVLIFILLLTALHEVMHILCYPQFWIKRIYIFLDKRTMAICLFYDGETSRERRLLLNVMPLVVLSCGMILASFTFDGNLRYVLQIAAFSNIALSSADIIGVFLLLKLPQKAILDNGIWRKGDV